MNYNFSDFQYEAILFLPVFVRIQKKTVIFRYARHGQ